MCLDVGRFTRSGLLADCACPTEILVVRGRGRMGDKANKGQRVQEQKTGGKRQRNHQQICDMKVTGAETQLQGAVTP